MALVRELDGVREEVVEHLREAALVAHERRGHAGAHLHAQLHALLARLHREEACRVAQAGGHVEGARTERHLARLDLREVQDVVQEAHQALAAAPDGAHVGLLVVVEGRLGEEVGVADDAVHGRADVVAHVGEKGALGTGGVLGLGAGVLGLGAGLLQGVRVLDEVLLRGLALGDFVAQLRVGALEVGRALGHEGL